MKKLVLALSILSCFSTVADSNNNPAWQERIYSDTNDELLSKNNLIQGNFLLDIELLKGNLSFQNTTNLAARTSSSDFSYPEINLPLPDGTFIAVIASPSNVISSAMAEAHPEIKTWTVVGVDDSGVKGVVDFTSNGFSGMLMMPDGDTIFIDPDTESAVDSYKVFSKKENISAFDNEDNNDSNSGVYTSDSYNYSDDNSETDFVVKSAETVLDDSLFPNLSVNTLRTYRLALSATTEYTDSQGGVAGARASMVTSINRINPIFERDLGISLELIDAPELIFSDADADPFSDPDDPSTLMRENGDYLSDQGRLDDFDIGHVLSYKSSGGGSGVAFLEVACLGDINTSNLGLIKGIKAAGATTSADPASSTFDLVLLAHELGHQLGANHSFNSVQGGNCSAGRSSIVAVEPGSGSSIMSYSGLCGTDDLPDDPRDDFFHFASISQINSYTQTGYGSTCGTVSSISNLPTLDAGADSKIPANTPFLLDGTASGGTSSWDQIDVGTASTVDTDTGDNAIIRHNIPTSDDDRYIPSLSNLFAGTQAVGEILPTTTRELNFSYVVRDGGIASDKKLIDVTNTGSIFSVTSHADSETITTNQTIQVTWNQAATDQSPISCSSVDIQLIKENGEKNMLLASTDNDGTENLVVPNTTPVMSDARVLVACSDNSFFNISSGSITVEEGDLTTTTEEAAPEETTTEVQDDTGQAPDADSTDTTTSGGGGSFDYLLIPLLSLLGLRRLKPVRVRTNQENQRRNK